MGLIYLLNSGTIEQKIRAKAILIVKHTIPAEGLYCRRSGIILRPQYSLLVPRHFKWVARAQLTQDQVGHVDKVFCACGNPEPWSWRIG